MSRETILRCHADYSARPAPANKYCSQTTGRATGSTRRHRPAALLALLYCILCFVQTATHRAGPGVPTADGAAEQQHQSTVHELLLLPARRSASDRSSRRLLSSANLEPLLVEGLEQSNDKADGLPENLIGSGSSFAAALHSVRAPYISHYVTNNSS